MLFFHGLIAFVFRYLKLRISTSPCSINKQSYHKGKNSQEIEQIGQIVRNQAGLKQKHSHIGYRIRAVNVGNATAGDQGVYIDTV